MLALRDLHVVGDWDAVQSLGRNNSRGIAVRGYHKVFFENLHLEAVRQMSLTADLCDQVTVSRCTVERSARDCMNFSGSRYVTITGCTIRHGCDDAIAVHVPHNVTDPTRKYGVVVTGNQIEDAKGIKILGGENIVIAHNNIMRPQLYGIYLGQDAGYKEGLVPHRNVVIQGNLITDMVRHEYLSVKHDIHTGILFNDRGREIHDTQIVDNVISKSKPSGPGVRYSDWGYGKLFMSGGWRDPELTAPHVGAGRGIRIFATNADDEEQIRIQGNIISGISPNALIQRRRG